MEDETGMSKVATTIKLSDNRECSIIDVRPSHIWKAEVKQKFQNPNGYGMFPFILEQILMFDYKPASVELIDSMDMQDYMKVVETVEVLISKLKI
jgi:hypothetical protein